MNMQNFIDNLDQKYDSFNWYSVTVEFTEEAQSEGELWMICSRMYKRRLSTVARGVIQLQATYPFSLDVKGGEIIVIAINDKGGYY